MDVLSVEEQQELATCEARIEQALISINTHKRKAQQEWRTIRQTYKALHLEKYLLTRWSCDACGYGIIVHGTPLRKRCPQCQWAMDYAGLVTPATYVIERDLGSRR
jgi:rubrerythrin